MQLTGNIDLLPSTELDLNQCLHICYKELKGKPEGHFKKCLSQTYNLVKAIPSFGEWVLSLST